MLRAAPVLSKKDFLLFSPEKLANFIDRPVKLLLATKKYLVFLAALIPRIAEQDGVIKTSMAEKISLRLNSVRSSVLPFSVIFRNSARSTAWLAPWVILLVRSRVKYFVLNSTS